MDRRLFLEFVAASPLLMKAAAADPMDRIGVSTWSLHRFFAASRGKDVPDSDLLKLNNFFKIVHDRWGVRRFEVVNGHFDSTDPKFLAEVKRTVGSLKGRIVNIPTDLRGTNLSDDDDEKRLATVAAVKKWIDIAAGLGSPAIRCNTGRARDENNLEPTTRSYAELARYGETKKVQILIENHGGISSDPDQLARLFKAVNHPNLGTLPDFGNFPNDEVRFRGLEMMFPYARVACHARAFDFDERGEMIGLDFRRCVALAEKLGFRGVYSIEFAGKADPYDAITRTIALLKQLLPA